MLPSFAPDASQLEVINFHARSRLVVTAGPGSGKTFTAALRAAKIFDEVNDGLPILAVSFSRAAAYAIRKSCWNAGCRTGIQFYTLDGWARSFVSAEGAKELGQITGRTFDEVVEHATSLLRAEDSVNPMFSHLLVDEAQDVSGIRRELVRELLKRSSMGWTLFGDLAQKIFDFSNSNSLESKPTNNSMVTSSRAESSRKFLLPPQLTLALDCVPVDLRDEVSQAIERMHVSGSQVTSDACVEEDAAFVSSESFAQQNPIDTLSILEEALGESLTRTEVHHLRLLEDHRSSTPELKSLRGLGDLLRGDEVSDSTVDTIWSEYSDIKYVVTVDLNAGKSARDELSGKLRVWGHKLESTAVLVKSRADLLAMSRHLSSSAVAVSHEVIPTKDEELVPEWVSGLAGVGSVDELFTAIPESLDRNVVFSLLKTRFVKGNRFDEDALVDDLRAGRVPEYLKSREFKGVFLSTIHRVKGLEFDRIILGQWNRPEDAHSKLNESRLMFVGLTRAALENWALDFSSRAIFEPIPSEKSRLAEKRYAGKSKLVTGIEVKSSDIRLLRPIPDSVEPVLHLESNSSGTPIRYVLGNADGSAEYGFALDRFVEAINAVAGGKNKSIPRRLHGLLRTGNCTIAPDTHQRQFWNEKKLVVAPVLAGVVNWKED